MKNNDLTIREQILQCYVPVKDVFTEELVARRKIKTCFDLEGQAGVAISVKSNPTSVAILSYKTAIELLNKNYDNLPIIEDGE